MNRNEQCSYVDMFYYMFYSVYQSLHASGLPDYFDEKKKLYNRHHSEENHLGYEQALLGKRITCIQVNNFNYVKYVCMTIYHMIQAHLTFYF